MGILSYVIWGGKLIPGGARPLLTQPCDLASLQQLASGSSSSLGLAFPRLVLGTASFLPSLSYTLVMWGIVSALLMVIGVFALSSSLSRDFRAGLLASVIATAVLSATGAFQFAEYPFLAGLAFSLMALAIIFGADRGEKPWVLPIASIPALLASLFDPYWGLILFFAVLGAVLLNLRCGTRLSRNIWPAAAVTPALVPSVVDLIVLRHISLVPFSFNFPLLVVLAASAAWSGVTLFLRSQDSTVRILPLVVTSFVAGIIVSPQYSVIPMTVLGTLAATKIGSRAIIVETSFKTRPTGNRAKDDVYNIEIDLMKLLSTIFVVLLLISSFFFGTLPFAQSLQQQRIDVNAFGTSQASDALN